MKPGTNVIVELTEDHRIPAAGTQPDGFGEEIVQPRGKVIREVNHGDHGVWIEVELEKEHEGGKKNLMVPAAFVKEEKL
jgi:hypothetical protein